jgi:hypothetical protein
LRNISQRFREEIGAPKGAEAHTLGTTTLKNINKFVLLYNLKTVKVLENNSEFGIEGTETFP